MALDDGRVITLKKVFHEVYKRQRGSANAEFTGHTTDYYIDGVPAKESEYTAQITAFCGNAEQMKMLTMPHYFAADMTWDSRRKILIDVCGDVTDDDVISSSPDLAALPGVLAKPGASSARYTVDEYRKIAAAQKAEINARLQEIPGRIDELSRSVGSVGGIDAGAIDADIDKAKAQLETLRTQRAEAAQGVNASAELRGLIAETKIKITEAEAAHLKAQAAANKEMVDGIDQCRATMEKAKADARAVDTTLADAVVRGGYMRRKRCSMASEYTEAEAKYKAALAETWDTTKEICPVCAKPIDADKVEAMREEFNLRKSTKLQAISANMAEINERGKRECSKEMLAALDAEIASLRAEAGACVTIIEEHKRLIAEMEASVITTAFEDTPKHKELSAELARLRIEAENADDTNRRAVDNKLAGIDAEIKNFSVALESLMESRAKLEAAKAAKARIAELEADEKRLGKEFETIGRNIYLCELFVKAKVSMITEAINGKFESVKFRLFVEQINGGVKDDCEVLVPADTGENGSALVPYRDANNAAKINAGMEIIGVLSKHWGMSMPVFIDNAESVTRLKAMDGIQTVALIVSEMDKVLRVETVTQGITAVKAA
jgi:hypothetical protein